MNVRSRVMAAGVVTLITMAICFFGVRSELNSIHRSGNQQASNQQAGKQPSPQAGRLDRGDADRYCARHFADGC